ncbi:MAG: serine/threonine-protein phosphatase, partial [Acidobacteria bacterium]
MPDTTVQRPSLLAAAASDVGRRRGNNEDRFHCDPARGIFMVIDGVGGHAAGERAAEIALRMLQARLERETGSPAERLREAITLANNEVNRLAAADPALSGMACVLTAAIVSDGRLTAGHVGDTRLYTFSQGLARKVTHDHSPVGEREDSGELDEMEAMRHPRRNEIFRDVGSLPHNPNDEEFIEILELPFGPENAFLLCTDGLSDLVPAAGIAGVVYAHADDPAAAVRQLIDEANEAGGKDNVTAVLVAGEGFAGTAARYRTSAGRAAMGSDWKRSVLRFLLFAGGAAAGLALAYAAFAWVRPAREWLLGDVRPASWSRTWRVGADASDDFRSILEALRRS